MIRDLLLDTDCITILQRGGAGVTELRRRLSTIAPDDYGTTIVSYEEQSRGWLSEMNDAQSSETRVAAYAKLKRNLNFFGRIAIAEYDALADAQYVALKQIVKNKVGTKDLRIAAIVLASGATLLTRNTRDFSKIPGLLFADWTVE